MNKKLRRIVNHYGIKSQLKYFQSEIFELNEAVIVYLNRGYFENVITSVCKAFLPLTGTAYKDGQQEHIKEEIADVMVMLKQIQLYFNISTKEVEKIMKYKIDRQINRIEEEENEKIQNKLVSTKNED